METFKKKFPFLILWMRNIMWDKLILAIIVPLHFSQIFWDIFFSSVGIFPPDGASVCACRTGHLWRVQQWHPWHARGNLFSKVIFLTTIFDQLCTVIFWFFKNIYCIDRPSYRKKDPSSQAPSRAASFSRPNSFQKVPSQNRSVKRPMVDLKPIEV